MQTSLLLQQLPLCSTGTCSPILSGFRILNLETCRVQGKIHMMFVPRYGREIDIHHGEYGKRSRGERLCPFYKNWHSNKCLISDNQYPACINRLFNNLCRAATPAYRTNSDDHIRDIQGSSCNHTQGTQTMRGPVMTPVISQEFRPWKTARLNHAWRWGRRG